MRAKKAIEWLRANEDGGIAAWAGHKPYPEVSGYLIPTLLDYGEKELAQKLAGWLVSIQNSDGSFDGLDGVKRTFDTGAVMEGLRAAGHKKEAVKAQVWLEKQTMSSGVLREVPDNDRTESYTMRVSGLLGNHTATEYWRNYPHPKSQRTHYLAYMLEGLLNLGYTEYVTEQLTRLSSSGLMPAYVDNNLQPVSGTDTTATAQIGILKLKCGMPFDPSALYALQLDNGGLPHDTGDSRQISWAIKYFLDLEKIVNV